MIYARLIGIDRYEHGDDLLGCNNDVANMASFLQRLNLGITISPPTLSDDNADLDAVLKALREDVARLRPDDQLIVHFSGHGSQLYVKGVSWAAACPFNFALDDDTSGIVEPDLQNVFGKLPPRARVTIFADCCFSGGLETDYAQSLGGRLFRAVRGMAKKVRLARSPLDRVRAFPGSTVPGTLPTVSGGPDVVVLAASGFAQESGEKDFGGAGAAGVQGVFTHFLIEHLSAAGNLDQPATATRDGVRALTAGTFEQKAELHGNTTSWDKPLIERRRSGVPQPVLV